MEAKFRAAIRFAAIFALFLSAACLPKGKETAPPAPPTDIALPSPTLPPPTSAEVQVPGLDAPMPFDEGQIQIAAVRLMESTSDAGDFPYALPPNYKATDANDIILAVIAVPFGADPSALAKKWKDLDVKIVDENGRESKPEIQGSGEQNGKWFVMWITAVSRTAKDFTLYLPPEIKVNITSLLTK